MAMIWLCYGYDMTTSSVDPRHELIDVDTKHGTTLNAISWYRWYRCPSWTVTRRHGTVHLCTARDNMDRTVHVYRGGKLYVTVHPLLYRSDIYEERLGFYLMGVLAPYPNRRNYISGTYLDTIKLKEADLTVIANNRISSATTIM